MGQPLCYRVRPGVYRKIIRKKRLGSKRALRSSSPKRTQGPIPFDALEVVYQRTDGKSRSANDRD